MTTESGNRKKLQEFFGREYQSLKVYVNSSLRESIHTDAEDIIQDVALKLFTGADRYVPIHNVAGYVYYAIRNKIIDVMRHNQRVRSDRDTGESKLLEFAELIYDTDDPAYTEHMKQELKEAIFGLKPDYREIILAIDFGGLSYREVARETGIPEGTLMSRRHRAISLLYKKLEIQILKD